MTKLILILAVIIVAVAVFAAAGLIIWMRRVNRDPCPNVNCRGHLYFDGNKNHDGRTVAVFRCDRCPEEIFFGGNQNEEPSI